MSRELEIENNVGYNLRNGNKIGSTVISRVTWSSNKVEIDDFKSYQELI